MNLSNVLSVKMWAAWDWERIMMCDYWEGLGERNRCTYLLVYMN